jgi:FdhE protein
VGVPKQARFFLIPLHPPFIKGGTTVIFSLIKGRAGGIILEKLKERVQQLKKKRPGYGEILDFYQKVKGAQDEVKVSLKMDPIKLKKGWKDLLTKEGFSLIEKEDFPLDIEASAKLFQFLCQIGKTSNPHMAEQVEKINEALDKEKMNLEKLLKMGVKEQEIEQTVAEFGLDNKVFLFLVRNSLRPSIEVGMEQLSGGLDSETWLKGYCPVCGSPPYLSLLREEVGKRYLICSFCGYSWRVDRLICPFCNNKDQEFLQYFYGEGEESYRVNLCDKCHQYIKTFDLRNLGESDPYLEDLATLHLDILASQKGYKRPVPNPWTI